jgi:hypothetical protein
MSDREAKQLCQVPVHDGSRNTNSSEKLANGRKWRFGKSRRDRFIDKTVSTICGFGRGGLFVWGKLNTLSVILRRGVSHRPFPKRSKKTVMDGIENHLLHAEIEKNRLRVHEMNVSKRPGQTFFWHKKPIWKRPFIFSPSFSFGQI